MTPGHGPSARPTHAATEAPGDPFARGLAATTTDERLFRHLVSVPDAVRRDIRVMIADDDDAIRRVLSDMIEAADDLELVGSAEDADGAAELAALARPDVILLDVRMPGGGPAAARAIATRAPATRVVALTAHDDRGSIREMIAEGAISYLTKDEPIEAIVAAIRDAAAGRTRLSVPVSSLVVSELGARLGRERRAEDERHEKRRRIRRILARGEGLEIGFQPIADLRSGDPVGAEALVRFPSEPPRPPDRWLAEAAEVALEVDLELAVLEASVADLDRVPDPGFVMVRIGPSTLRDPGLGGILRTTPRGRTVVKVGQHTPMLFDPDLRAAVEELRRLGVRIAVDASAAGSAGLRHLVELRPSLLTLDRTLFRRDASGPINRAFLGSLAAFAGELGVELLAERVETSHEAEVLLAAGVRLASGPAVGALGADPSPEPREPAPSSS